MKVLHFAHCFFPVCGGTTTRLYNMLANGVNEHFLYVPQAPSPYVPASLGRLNDEDVFNNIKVRRVSLAYGGRRFSFLRRMEARSDGLVSYVKERDIQIVHGHSPIEFAVAAMKYSKQNSLPFIYEVHGALTVDILKVEQRDLSALLYFLLIKVMKRVEKRVFESADYIITYTGKVKQRIVELYSVNEDRVIVIPHGVDENKFHLGLWSKKGEEVRRKEGWKEKVVLMYTGFLDKINGIDFFLECTKDLPSEVKKKVKVVILGQGPLQKYVERVSGEKDFIEYLGSVDYKDVPMYYSSCDIFVIPRPSTLPAETALPVKLLEAMAMQRIVLVSDVGGMADVVVNTENGFVFRKGDCKDLVEKITYLVENVDDLGYVGKRARNDVIHKYNWRKAREDMQEIYEKVVR